MSTNVAGALILLTVVFATVRFAYFGRGFFADSNWFPRLLLVAFGFSILALGAALVVNVVDQPESKAILKVFVFAAGPIMILYGLAAMLTGLFANLGLVKSWLSHSAKNANPDIF